MNQLHLNTYPVIRSLIGILRFLLRDFENIFLLIPELYQLLLFCSWKGGITDDPFLRGSSLEEWHLSAVFEFVVLCQT